MINSKPNTLVRLSKLLSDNTDVSTHRDSSSIEKKPRETNSSATPLKTRAGSAISFKSGSARRLSSIENLQEDKKYKNERSLFTDQSSSSQLGLHMAIIKTKDIKGRSISSYRLQRNSSLAAYQSQFTERTCVDEKEQSSNKENDSKTLEETKGSILKDIPRMKDVSSIVKNVFRNTRDKWEKVSQTNKVDLGKTFRSKFEEEIILAAQEKAAVRSMTAGVKSKYNLCPL